MCEKNFLRTKRDALAVIQRAKRQARLRNITYQAVVDGLKGGKPSELGAQYDEYLDLFRSAHSPAKELPLSFDQWKAATIEWAKLNLAHNQRFEQWIDDLQTAVLDFPMIEVRQLELEILLRI